MIKKPKIFWGTFIALTIASSLLIMKGNEEKRQAESQRVRALYESMIDDNRDDYFTPVEEKTNESETKENIETDKTLTK